jgi:REase_DpnII-MboI
VKSSRAIAILERQRQAIPGIKTSKSNGPEFTKWHRDTEIALERIFSVESRNVQDFKGISYHLGVFSSSTSDHEFHQAYVRGLDKADAVLASMIDEIRDYIPEEKQNYSAPDKLSVVELLCLRFHLVARALQNRHNNRSAHEINDEYDVQDLLHALLKLHFDDVRPEEWTPSYAGSASRVDFLLKEERIVVEVKKTHEKLKSSQLGEQLIIDRARYEHHPDCHTLVCFVYDPEGRIGNPAGIERDLENYNGNLKMRVIIAPKF